MAAHNSEDEEPATNDGAPETKLKSAAKTVSSVANSGLIVALIALSGVLIGSKVAGDQANMGLVKQIQAEKERQERDFEEKKTEDTKNKRARVYSDFVSEVEKYDQLVRDYSNRDVRPWPAPNHPTAGLTVYRKVSAEDLAEAKSVFLRRFNDVSVYGSDTSWKSAERIRDALFVAISKYYTQKQKQKLLWIGRDNKLNVALGEFRKLMCLELSPAPRSGCYSGE
ncbi:hypothetical protein ACIBI3_43615 [Actinomadura luteofluorescens]|uniref:hypothetical protein n=1 Tax=Actinomadura luteofluorescens TaxID=46163 RepID=UPI0034796317